MTLLLPVPRPRYGLRGTNKLQRSKSYALPCDSYMSKIQSKDHFSSFHSNKRRRRGGLRCGIVVFNPKQDKIVLISNKYTLKVGITKWGAPKGHRNPGESYPSCAIREGMEETGLRTAIYPNSHKIFIKNTYYFPIMADSELPLSPKDTKEIEEARWVPIKDLDIYYNVNRELKALLTKMTRLKDMALHTNAKIYNIHRLSPHSVYKHPNFREDNAPTTTSTTVSI